LAIPTIKVKNLESSINKGRQRQKGGSLK
jgi:hypothetical protein